MFQYEHFHRKIGASGRDRFCTLAFVRRISLCDGAANSYEAAMANSSTSGCESTPPCNEISANALDDQYQAGYRKTPEDISAIEALLPYLAIDIDE